MITIENIRKELEELEQDGAMTWNTVEKMAALITVHDYLAMKQGGVDGKIGFRYQTARAGIRPTQNGELEEIESRMSREEIANEFNRHLEDIRSRHPMDYENTVRRMRDNYRTAR